MTDQSRCEHPIDKIQILDTYWGFRAVCAVCGERSPGKIYKQDARDLLRKRGEAKAGAKAGKWT